VFQGSFEEVCQHEQRQWLGVTCWGRDVVEAALVLLGPKTFGICRPPHTVEAGPDIEVGELDYS